VPFVGGLPVTEKAWRSAVVQAVCFQGMKQKARNLSGFQGTLRFGVDEVDALTA